MSIIAANQELTLQDVWQLIRETQREFKEIQQESRQRSQETERMFQRTDRRMERTDRMFREFRKDISDLTDSWGEFVESMVEPAMIRLFAARNIIINSTYTRIKCRRPGLEMEVDILGVNTEYVVAVEVKTTLKVDDVNDHLERLAKFKRAFPEYQERHIVGAVAGMRLSEGVGRYAYRKGLYVLAQSGDTVEMLNDAAFTPQVW